MMIAEKSLARRGKSLGALIAVVLATGGCGGGNMDSLRPFVEE
jgi:hypothetical protein